MLIPLLERSLALTDPLFQATTALPTVIVEHPSDVLKSLRPASYWVPYTGEATTVIDALNSGAGRVIVDVPALSLSADLLANAFADVANEYIRDRSALRVTLPIGAPVPVEDINSALAAASSLIIRISAEDTTLPAFEATLLAWIGAWSPPADARLILQLAAPISPTVIASLDARSIDVTLATSALSLDTASSSSTSPATIPLATAFIAPLTSERQDGLFPTIVVDEQGVSLGLVYSNPESIAEALKTGRGVYWSRKRGLWRKGESSGAGQILRSISFDCDRDTLCFTVHQTGSGFCHLNTRNCFGEGCGITHLQRTLQSRLASSPEGSYTARLFADDALLRAKIFEEAEELVTATSKSDIAWEAGDLLYFTMVWCVKNGVNLTDIERELDRRSAKVSRRPGNAKAPFIEKVTAMDKASTAPVPAPAPAPAQPKAQVTPAAPARIRMQHHRTDPSAGSAAHTALLQRPIIESTDIHARVRPIMEDVRARGDAALRDLTAKFDGVDIPIPILRAPFPEDQIATVDPEVRAAIDQAYLNIRAFHLAQLPSITLTVETQPGVTCSRFARPIQRVGLYVPGGTAILPSTALMLGVPAQVAGCQEIVVACPPRRSDGLCSPEVLYAAQKVGATVVVLAGGAQAVAAMAYGTASVPKVDKICGPGNQYVTAAKMLVQNDASAMVAIDMPAGPSELLVIADEDCIPAYVASDLLSQAEHGPDSQVVLVAAAMSDAKVEEIERELEVQGEALPRADIVRLSIPKSYVLRVPSIPEAISFSNAYAPEHLILHINDPDALIPHIQNAGSVFLGPYSPESCGDYASGTNHTLPTYGYARMYSGVSTDSFLKYITAQSLTKEGLNGLGDTVMALAAVEGLEAHRNAVAIRLADLRK